MGQENSKDGGGAIGANGSVDGSQNGSKWGGTSGLGSGAGGAGSSTSSNASGAGGNRGGNNANNANGKGGGAGGNQNAGNNSKSGGAVDTPLGMDDPIEDPANANNPLATASVIDSSRNRFVMFMSSSPTLLAVSDFMSRSSLNSSKYSVGSKGSALTGLKSIKAGIPGTQPGDCVTPNTTPLASANGSTTGTVAPLNGSGGAGGIGGDANGGGGSGQASPVQGALNSPFGATKGIQQLPPFGFTSPSGVSGWNNLTDCSLEDEIEEYLPEEVLKKMRQEEKDHPQQYQASHQTRRSKSGSVVADPNQRHDADAADSSPEDTNNNNKNNNGMGKPTNSFTTSNTRKNYKPNQMQVAVLSTPRQMVLSALQPLASSAATSANADGFGASGFDNVGGSLSDQNNRSEKGKKSAMVVPTPSDTGSCAAPFSAEIRKRMEAASRIRYAVPTNYTMTCVGSQPRPIRTVCSTGDGGQYLVIAMESSLARLIEPGQPVGSSLLDFRGMMDELIASAVSRDGRYVVLSAKDGAVTSWDLTNGKKVRDLSVTTPVRAIALSDDGELVAGTTGEDSVAVWETKSGDTLSNCSIHSSPPTAVTISRRGNLAASGTVGGEVCVWQCPSGSVTFRFTSNRKPIRSLSFSADGSRLLAVDCESLRIWDTFTGELVVSRYTDDSISLGEEEPIAVSNGSLSQSVQQQAQARNRIQSVSTQSQMRDSLKGDGENTEGGGGGLTGAQLNHLQGNGSNTNMDDDRNTSPPNPVMGASRGPRTGPIDPMEQIFQRSASPSFTCGSFAACNIAVVGTNTGLMMLMEPNTGTELLSLSCRSAVRSLSAAWQGDVLYLGDNSGNVYKVKMSFSAKAIQDFNVGLKTNNGRDNKRANMD